MKIHYTLGMPQLSFGALSENWLTKECGNIHWLKIAHSIGMPKPEFVDAANRKLYAAFCALSITSARFGLAEENGDLEISTRIGAIKPGQHISCHMVACNGVDICTVKLISAFVRRELDLDNTTVVRGISGTCAGMEENSEEPFARCLRDMRRGKWGEHFGFRRIGSVEAKSYRIFPCPYSDFNGADFLYFANFPQLVDRAEWEWSKHRLEYGPVLHREVYFYGNINVSDGVDIVAMGNCECTCASDVPALKSWCRLRRTDGVVIADVFTVRSRSGRGIRVPTLCLSASELGDNQALIAVSSPVRNQPIS